MISFPNIHYTNLSRILPRSGRCVSATAPACSRFQPAPMDFGAPRRLQDASKRPFFPYHFSDALWDRFLMDLGSIFPPKLAPKTHRNPLKIDAKRHSILDFKSWLILDRFWFPTCDPRTHEIAEILSVLWALFALRHFQAKIEFWFHLGSELIAFPFLKSTTFPSQIDFQSHRCFDRFSHRFLYCSGCNLEPSWASSWTHLGL